LVFPRIELVSVDENWEIILWLTISVNYSLEILEEWAGWLFWIMCPQQQSQDRRVEIGEFGVPVVEMSGG
jgi:hypothetical protein